MGSGFRVFRGLGCLRLRIRALGFSVGVQDSRFRLEDAGAWTRVAARVYSLAAPSSARLSVTSVHIIYVVYIYICMYVHKQCLGVNVLKPQKAKTTSSLWILQKEPGTEQQKTKTVPNSNCVWLAGNDGMEKKTEITVMCYFGTTIRFHSFITS